MATEAMKLVFVGTVELSRHCLKEVIANGGNVVAVLIPAAENAKFNSDCADPSEVAEVAKAYGMESTPRPSIWCGS